jgi:hypothetical protein
VDHTAFDFGLPFAFHFLNEPPGLGLPPRVFSAQIETRLVQPLGDRYGVDVSVIPGFFSDFDSGKNNGFRVTGHLIGTMKLSEEFKFALGAMYLGRQDVPILPAGGVVWTMRPETELELLMPKPRIRQQIHCRDGWQEFIYTGFELFGGNSWAVTRPHNSYDTFTYRDFRFLVGHEMGKIGLMDSFFEIGYVFGRRVEFKNDPTTLNPPGTLLLRLGSSY